MSAQRTLPPATITMVCAVTLLSALPFTAAAAATDEADFFEAQIRPLLVEHCVSCHGQRRQEGGLRLDSKASLLRGGDSGPAAIAGNPSESRMFQAVEYSDDLQMPPTG